MITLTQEEKDILNHIIEETPEAWITNSCNKFGDETARKHLDAKCAKWKPIYDQAVIAGNYNNRNERDAVEEKINQDAWASDLATARLKRKKELSARLRNSFFPKHTDPHIAKSSNAMGGDGIPVAQYVKDYYIRMKELKNEAKVTIDSMTDIKKIRDYNPKWLLPPTE